MHIVILTRTWRDGIGGIWDHSRLLGDSLRSKGHQVTHLTSEEMPGESCRVVHEFWTFHARADLVRTLAELDADHLVLQYTPLTFAIEGQYQNFRLADLWRTFSSKWKTSLILHETYFRVWWHPPSWLRGSLEKQLMKKMVQRSNYVFTASQPLFEEIKSWADDVMIELLPIGSNFPVVTIDRGRWRSDRQIRPNDLVLVLFGGGNSLKWLSGHVNAADALLIKNGITAYWLLLGGVPRKWFKLRSSVISPGRLSQEDISGWLQASDIFLTPHFAGLCAKRGTLMAALQHSLPVVGTRSPMTDSFWDEVSGVVLTPMPGARKFARNVLKVATSKDLRKEMGAANRSYFEAHFTWDMIAQSFLEYTI